MQRYNPYMGSVQSVNQSNKMETESNLLAAADFPAYNKRLYATAGLILLIVGIAIKKRFLI
jgi:hypothetical protein